MKSCKFLVLTILYSCMLFLPTYAQSFQLAYLETAAQRLNLNNLDTLHSGVNILSYQGFPLVIIRNDDNVINHIGYRIFASSLRTEHPSPVYNYIEYALLNHKLHLTDDPLIYRDLKFLSGSWQELEGISETTAVRIEAVQDKHYILTWFLSTGKEICLQVPIHYERLSMVNRRELEQNIIRDIKRYQQKALVQKDFNRKNLRHNDRGVAYQAGQMYLDKEINNNLYFEDVDSAHLSLMYSSDYPIETIANLCVAADMMEVDDTIDLCFVKYDHSKEKATVRLRDFIGCMKSEGCVPYWGLESVDEERIQGALFLYDKNKGFNHVLKIEANRRDVAAGARTLTATAYLLSPTTNVRNLNYQYNVNQ